MRSYLITAAAVLGLLAPLPFTLGKARADGVASRPGILSVKDLKPGMKGYGLTVFEGTKPDKFDVEIIGVLKDFQPKQELILIKTKHPRLEVAKVVAGMSGSPIYIDGKMIGAYSYGWGFGVEPVAGVTPIRNMLDDLDRPFPKALDGIQLGIQPRGAQRQRLAALGGSRWRGKLADYDLGKHAEQLARAKQQAGPSAQVAAAVTPLLMGGVTTGAMEVARELLSPLGFEPMQAGGAGGEVEADAPTRFVDGGAIGVQLVRGDMGAMGLGTVTRVEGDKLIGFGHPMMQAGYTALPTAIGKVLWFMSTAQRSFKMGYPVRPVGALIGDRQASIVVSHSAKAPVIPVTLKIKGATGAPYTEWKFEVAHEKFMAPTFMAIALGTVMQTTASERMDVSWTAKSKLKLKGYPAIQAEDFGVAVGGTPEPGDFFRTAMVRNAAMLLNNPWGPVQIESAEMEFELRYGREIQRLRGMELLDREVDPGQPARIRLTLIPWAGKPQTRVISVPIPKRLAGQSVTLFIQPGYTQSPELADPETLGDLIANLGVASYPPKSICVTYTDLSLGVAYQGRLARQLPPGAFDALRPTSGSIIPERVASVPREFIPIPDFMIGTDSVTVKVRPALR